MRQVAKHQVVAPVVLQHLRQRVAAHRGLNRILHIGNVDLVTGRCIAIHGEVLVGLAEHAKDAEILNAFDLAHHADNLIGLLFESLQILRHRPWLPVRL